MSRTMSSETAGHPIFEQLEAMKVSFPENPSRAAQYGIRNCVSGIRRYGRVGTGDGSAMADLRRAQASRGREGASLGSVEAYPQAAVTVKFSE